MAIEIVDLPIKNGDFPWQHVQLPEGHCWEKPYVFRRVSHRGRLDPAELHVVGQSRWAQTPDIPTSCSRPGSREAIEHHMEAMAHLNR
jgi:hypothetical protein